MARRARSNLSKTFEMHNKRSNATPHKKKQSIVKKASTRAKVAWRSKSTGSVVEYKRQELAKRRKS